MREPAPGVEFGRYVMVGRPQSYGAGSLVAAREARSGARRSLWLVTPRVVADADARAAVVRAATALRRLDSPHLVQLHEFGEEDGQPFFATGPLDGVDLAQICAPDGIPPVEALELVAQIGTGINHLHHAGLVDGALGAERVLVEDREGRAHASVVHAGLLPLLVARSELFAPQHEDARRFGAPELLDGAEPTVRSDLYSLGCLLWLALTGEAPFPSYAGHRTSPVPQVAGDGAVEEAVNSVLLRALAKDPALRYRDAAAFVATVRSVAALARDGSAGELPHRLVPRRSTGAHALRIEAPAAEVAAVPVLIDVAGQLAPVPASEVATPAPAAEAARLASTHHAAVPSETERALRAAEEHWASGLPVSRGRGSKKRRKRAVRAGVVAAGIGLVAVVAVWGARHLELVEGSGANPSAGTLPDTTASSGSASDPLALLFPIAAGHACTFDTAQVAHRIERWTCERHGYRVVLTHWDSEANAHALVPHDGDRGAREPWVLEGTRTGTQWTWRSAAGPRAFRWTAVYADAPYAVIIEAKDRARRQYAREHVVIHPSTVLG